MKKLYALTALVSLLSSNAQAQQIRVPPLSPPLKKHALYIQVLGGTANLATLGYERKVYHTGRFSFYGRLGLSWFPMRLKMFDGRMSIGGNIEAGTLWGGPLHKLELGFGFGYNYLYPRNFQFFNPNCRCASDMKVLGLRLGYRHVSKRQNWYYHIAFTPYLFLDRNQPGDIYINNFIEPEAGIGVGWQL